MTGDAANDFLYVQNWKNSGVNYVPIELLELLLSHFGNEIRENAIFKQKQQDSDCIQRMTVTVNSLLTGWEETQQIKFMSRGAGWMVVVLGW